MSENYEDIIHLPHHVSSRRTPMSMIDRAAQFSPFAALTGYDAVIQETARQTDRPIEPDETGRAELNEQLRFLSERIEEQPVVGITFFQPDERKSGGAYVSVTGRVRKIDEYSRAVILTDGRVISFEAIYQIDA